MKLADLTKPKTKRIKMSENTTTVIDDKQIKEEFPANVEESKEFNEVNSNQEKVESKYSNSTLMEPLKNNRFIITFPNVDIHPYLFRNYEMFNEGENLIFTTEFLETITYTFNPKDFFKITDVKIEYLDPVGEVVGGMTFKVKGSNFNKKGDYSDDNLQLNTLRFVVDIDSIQTLFTYGK
jgi:hypothetical protein